MAICSPICHAASRSKRCCQNGRTGLAQPDTSLVLQFPLCLVITRSSPRPSWRSLDPTVPRTIPYMKHCNLHVRLGFPPITLLRRYQIAFLRRPSPADGSMPTVHLLPHSIQSRIHAPGSSLPSKCLNASSPPNHHLLFPCRPSRSLAMNSRKHLVVGFIFSMVRARASGIVE